MAAREFQDAIAVIDKTLPLLRQHIDLYPQFAAAIEDDIEAGRTPTGIVCSVGATGTTASAAVHFLFLVYCLQ